MSRDAGFRHWECRAVQPRLAQLVKKVVMKTPFWRPPFVDSTRDSASTLRLSHSESASAFLAWLAVIRPALRAVLTLMCFIAVSPFPPIRLA